VGQIEGQRLVEDHHVDAVAELRAQERAQDRQHAAGGGERDRQAELDADPHQRALARASSPVPAAWTTASTRRLPVHAIAPGISPSSTLPTASAIVIGRLVVHTSPSARRA
jgi:hypothetical protein